MCGRLVALPDSLFALLSRFPQQIGQSIDPAVSVVALRGGRLGLRSFRSRLSPPNLLDCRSLLSAVFSRNRLRFPKTKP